MNYKKISIMDIQYPKILKKISNPPEVLYAIGNIKLLGQSNFAIVGARNCSEEGAKTAKQFASELSKGGFNIVSGMAKGIDTASHIGCMEAQGMTIAVLGSEFKYIFPKENEKLFNKILDKSGLIISEYPPNTPPDKTYFPKRNRIISGISLGVLVVEAKCKSGSSITAQYAKKQKKKVYCIPHSIEDEYGIGTNRLIKRGAKLVTAPLDIIQSYKKLTSQDIQNIKDIESNKYIPEEYKQIYEVLSKEPKHINEICRCLRLNIQEVTNKLILMELEGYIIQKNLNEYIKK